MAHQERISKNIFRAYDIRGIYPADFNQEAAYKIGVALANKIKSRPEAVVAMDGRLSNSIIKDSLISGLTDYGIKVTLEPNAANINANSIAMYPEPIIDKCSGIFLSSIT